MPQKQCTKVQKMGGNQKKTKTTAFVWPKNGKWKDNSHKLVVEGLQRCAVPFNNDMHHSTGQLSHCLNIAAQPLPYRGPQSGEESMAV